MPQRNALGPAGAAAGMQNQRDIVGAGFGRGSGVALRGKHFRMKHRDAGLDRRAAGFAQILWRGNQDFGASVFQIKTELLEFVAWIQRRGGACHGCGEESRHGLQSVGQRDGHAVAAANSRAAQSTGHGAHLPPQGVIGHALAGIGENDGAPAAVGGIQHFEQSPWVAHLCNIAKTSLRMRGRFGIESAA